MRAWFTIFVFVFSPVLCLALHNESVEAMARQADAAKLRDQPVLYAKIAESQLKAADEFYDAGKYAEARDALADVVKYSGKSSDAAIRSGKKLKETEIVLRKFADKLRDIKRSAEFEEQAPVQDAIDHLEQYRTQLLSRMFGKGAK